MSSEITEKDSMFSVKEVPWHKIGTIVDKAPTIEEGIKLAKLDWEVKLQPLFREEDKDSYKKTTHFASVRSDTNDVLGIVGPNWQPLQNIDSFGFFDKFIESGQASLETAGSLKGGEIVWVLAKINVDPIEIVANDPIVRYMLLSNGHNGQLAVRAGFTDTRVVCANTLNISHNSDASKLIRIKHTGRMQENIENVKMVMDVANREFVANMEQLKMLTNKDINSQDIKDFVKLTFFNKRPLDSNRAQNNFSRMVNRFEELIEVGKGADTKNVRGTYWGLYNAATEYLTHEHGKTTESRLKSIWFGENSKLNERIFQVAMKMSLGETVR